MSQRTGISWTDATWNPIRGCSRVSEGCRNCYAESVAARFSGPGQAYEGLATMTKAGPRWTGTVVTVEKHLHDPLRWRAPRRIFVNSMSDLFHEKLSDRDIDAVFAVMAKAQRHTFQILTKRPERMREYSKARALGLPLPNCWLGVSVENQDAANERIPILLDTPAAVRWLSCEPLLGPLELGQWLAPAMRVSQGVPPDQRKPLGRETIRALNQLGRAALRMHGGGAFVDWVVAGGESGAGFRPLEVEWIDDLWAQCGLAGVPFWCKQASGLRSGKQGDLPDDLWNTKEFPAQSGVPA